MSAPSLRLSPFFLAALLSLAACAQTEVTRNAPEDDAPTDDREFDDNPTVVGDDAPNNDDPANNDFEVPGPTGDPEAVWTPPAGDFILVDDQTGSRWSVRGEAFEGPLAGHQLEKVPAFNSFWFAWSVFYGGSEVWNREAPVDVPDIEPDGECLVPCDEIRLGCSGRDCIPALDYDGRDGRPVAEVVAADDPEAAYLEDHDTILGVVIDGEARAYPHNLLWWHEIHNDKIGDTEFSATLCPLTGSGIVFAGSHDGEPVDFGVSGNLYNSNLVMFDRDGDTLWSQMMLTGITGSQIGERLELLPVVETTWGRWVEMYPGTGVASDATGYSRNYDAYPYGAYRSNDDTFRPTNPDHSDMYHEKDLVLGLVGQEGARAYPFSEMGSFGDRVVVQDTFEGRPIVVVFEAEHAMAIPFVREVDGQPLTFTAAVAE